MRKSDWLYLGRLCGSELLVIVGLWEVRQASPYEGLFQRELLLIYDIWLSFAFIRGALFVYLFWHNQILVIYLIAEAKE